MSKSVCFTDLFQSVISPGFLAVILWFAMTGEAIAKVTFVKGNYEAGQLSAQLNAALKLYDDNKLKAARKSFEELCETDDAIACHYAGQMYEEGIGTFKDNEAAHKFYKKSCDLNDGLGCLLIADHLQRGKTLKEVDKSFWTFLEKSCSLNMFVACSAFGNLYYHGISEFDQYLQDKMKTSSKNINCEGSSVSDCQKIAEKYFENKSRATKYAAKFEASCKKGNAPDCFNYGKLLFENEDYDKYTYGIDNIYQACKLDFAPACYYLIVENRDIAYDFYKENRSYQDVEQEILDKHCRKNEFDFCLAPIKLTLNGYQEPTIMYARRIANLEYACNAGYGTSCGTIPPYEAKANNNVWNYNKAQQNYSKGCELGDPVSCYNLGAIHWLGLGNASQKHEAVNYFEKSCSLKLSAGCHGLALTYYFGIGRESDLKKAKQLLIIACQQTLAACHDYAVFFQNPESVAYEKTMKRACEQGKIASACKYLISKLEKKPKSLEQEFDLENSRSSLDNSSANLISFPYLIKLSN